MGRLGEALGRLTCLAATVTGLFGEVLHSFGDSFQHGLLVLSTCSLV
jgi:hypothetical protein